MGLVTEVAGRVRGEMHKAVVGQEKVIDELLIALLCEGHVLIEGVPGVGKTLMVKALAMSLNAGFQRIQFTPDLMPSDVIGTNVFDLSTSTFHLKRGPLFTEVLLADEINRTPPKTQSALLEAMEERQVTIDGASTSLSPLFTVFATQNPVEYEGTYPLPEAQLDRFMLKVIVDYPSDNDECDILRKYHGGFSARNLPLAGVQAVTGLDEMLACRREIQAVTVEDSIISYIASIVRTSRNMPELFMGASPRAGIVLLAGAKCLAAISGRSFIVPDDVKRLAYPVLRHRLVLRPDVEIEGRNTDDLITSLLESVRVPR